MATQNLKTIESKIGKLTDRMARTGNMRPGSLSVQYRNPSEKKNPFHQISYTHKGKSRSEYVRMENLQAVRDEIATYKRFRTILEQLIELSIRASRIRCGTRTS